ncbi:PKD domain-containing protein [Candidatus Electrothrix sp.]|uniref:PKD domain-containing protein n=1 Tax=Candidatus Electrothrix sp. TaxID=2170559 RepID=UPI00405604AF
MSRTWANRPPVADAGKDYYGMGEYYEVLEGRTVELDGSNSYDPDGDELISYDWDLNEDGTFETPSSDGFTTFSAAGYDAGAKRIRMYVFLKVVDEHGAEDIAQARVQIYDQAPTAAFALPSEPQLDCTAVQFTDQSTSEVDDIVSWAWDFGGLGSSTEQNPSFTFTDAGDHNVCLTVTDDDGSTDTACKTVTILDVPPTALAKDITVQLDASGKALISATDIDNGSSDTCGIASMTVSPSSFTCADVGANTVTLTVTDNHGVDDKSAATITVVDGDSDEDGVTNCNDNCSGTELGAVVDGDGCSIDQLCPCEGPQGIASLWKNHGKHVSCTAKSAESFVETGLITEAEKDVIVSDAAQSDCGDKK